MLARGKEPTMLTFQVEAKRSARPGRVDLPGRAGQTAKLYAPHDPARKPITTFCGVGWLMDWFRVYHDIIDDPKFITLPLDVLGFWVATLSVASRARVRGSLPDVEEIAFRTRQPLAVAQVHIETMIARKLLTRDSRGKLAVYKWDEYQTESDDVAARMRKYRAKKKAEKVTQSGGQPATKKAPKGVAPEAQNEPVTDSANVTNALRTGDVTGAAFVTRYVTRSDKRERGENTEPLTSFEAQENLPVSHSPAAANPRAEKTAAAADGQRTSPPDLNGSEHFIRSPGHRACVDAALAAFGVAVASTVAERGQVIEQRLGGRWDCLEASIAAAKRCTRPIQDVYAWCLRSAEAYTREGVPPPPVAASPASAPPLSPAQQRRAEASAALRAKGEQARAELAREGDRGEG